LLGLLTAPEESLGPLSEELLLLRNYLLAATAKDLSIFLTVRREPTPDRFVAAAAVTAANGGIVRLHLGEATYCVSIRLIDLDPKHVHKISKYVSKKLEWLEALRYWK
jgi:Inositol-pentakisphosphate 2-kinase